MHCPSECLTALPAAYTTVSLYLGNLHVAGTIAAGSVGAFLALSGIMLELMVYPPPGANPIFKRLCKGYMRLDAAKAGAMAFVMVPLSADVILSALP